MTSGSYFIESSISTDIHLYGEDKATTSLSTFGMNSIITCDGCSATFENLTLTQSMAPAVTIASGQPILKNLLFVANVSIDDGAAISMSNAQPILSDITFASNRSSQSGGAIYALESDIDATIYPSGNRSSIDGGAIALVNLVQYLMMQYLLVIQLWKVGLYIEQSEVHMTNLTL